jgi:hypothetical protein
LTDSEPTDPQPADRILVRVGTPFCTLDRKSFGVVLKLWESDDGKVWVLAIMDSGRYWLTAEARMVAAGAVVLRQYEVEIER